VQHWTYSYHSRHTASLPFVLYQLYCLATDIYIYVCDQLAEIELLCNSKTAQHWTQNFKCKYYINYITTTCQFWQTERKNWNKNTQRCAIRQLQFELMSVEHCMLEHLEWLTSSRRRLVLNEAVTHRQQLSWSTDIYKW